MRFTQRSKRSMRLAELATLAMFALLSVSRTDAQQGPAHVAAAHGERRELLHREPAHVAAGQPHKTLTAFRQQNS